MITSAWSKVLNIWTGEISSRDQFLMVTIANNNILYT